MKRKMFVILVCLLLAVILEGSALAYEMSEAGAFPIVDEAVEITVFTAPYAMTEDMATNSQSLWIEELTNVKINWVVTNQADATQKINLILASGADMPDAFMVPNSYISTQQIVAYGEQGYFVPLNDMIDQWGVNTQALFEARPGLKEQCTAPDGNIYFLPKYNESYHSLYPYKAFINQTWLENVGMDMPTTTDELLEVLKAFRDQDANGNGDSTDEIPLVTTNLMGWLTDPFMATSTYQSLLVQDGVVSFDFVSEEYKEALKFMKTLYDEKLIPEDIFMLTEDQLKVLTGDPEGNRVGVCVQGVVSGFVDVSTDVKEEFVACPVLIGPSGRQATSKAGVYFEPTFIITSECKDPEVAFRWADAQMVDLMKDDYHWVSLKYGPETEANTWRRAEEGEVAVNGSVGGWAMAFNWGETLNTHWYEMGPGFFSDEFKTSVVVDRNVWNQEVVLYDATKDLYEPHGVSVSMPNILLMNSELAEVIGGYGSIFTDYAEQARVKFVNGTWDIDGDWDQYLAELKNMGADEFIDAWQQAYDAIYETD